MNYITFFEKFWQGYSVASAEVSGNRLNITLKPQGLPHCNSCGEVCFSVHDYMTREIRDLSCFEYSTVIQLGLRRVNCSSCGIKTEKVPWLSPYARMTNRMRIYIENLCRILPISHVAKHLKLHWSTVKEIDKRRLIKDIPATDYSQIKELMMDEFALHKGHRYATVVADAKTLQVLWIGEGRSRKSIAPFFEEVGKYCKNIEVVAMDMNTAFDLEVKAHCPNAEVVYDLFHVVAKFGRDVIDRVRVDRANELKEDKKARRCVKQGRWLLLRNRSNLKEGQDIKLTELLEANKPLSVVYLLKEELKQIWYCQSFREAYRRWKSWYKQVNESEIEALKKFARNLKPYFRGIIASAKFPFGTNALEGMNNKIKVIKRMAYGYRDSEYFFLKIKDAFPGKP